MLTTELTWPASSVVSSQPGSRVHTPSTMNLYEWRPGSMFWRRKKPSQVGSMGTGTHAGEVQSPATATLLCMPRGQMNERLRRRSSTAGRSLSGPPGVSPSGLPGVTGSGAPGVCPSPWPAAAAPGASTLRPLASIEMVEMIFCSFVRSGRLPSSLKLITGRSSFSNLRTSWPVLMWLFRNEMKIMTESGCTSSRYFLKRSASM
mmetsp:Transcript_11102/g.45267  ORF Transcript_11102/g.45267 Transcript_11102/m.45267 type:complete len:204 (-) Transcript_11102:1416-2027(-)